VYVCVYVCVCVCVCGGMCCTVCGCGCGCVCACVRAWSVRACVRGAFVRASACVLRTVCWYVTCLLRWLCALVLWALCRTLMACTASVGSTFLAWTLGEHCPGQKFESNEKTRDLSPKSNFSASGGFRYTPKGQARSGAGQTECQAEVCASGQVDNTLQSRFLGTHHGASPAG
jgi:hypothetical protein